MERRIVTNEGLTWWMQVLDSEMKRQLEIKDNAESFKQQQRN